jgi:spore germination protein KA
MCFSLAIIPSGDVGLRTHENQYSWQLGSDMHQKKLSGSLDTNLDRLKLLFRDDATFVVRSFSSRSAHPLRFSIAYLSGMTDLHVAHQVLKTLMQSDLSDDMPRRALITLIPQCYISAPGINQIMAFGEVLTAILMGDFALFVDGLDKAFVIPSSGYKKRDISKSLTEAPVHGPKESFLEDLDTNLIMVRRKIKNSQLKFLRMTVGTITRTKICICYMDNLVRKDIVSEVKERLNKVDIDGILDSGYLQKLIRDHPYSFFELMNSSEKPDSTAAEILEGRIAIFVDGSPFVLTVPYILTEMAQASEDYYINFFYSSFNRILRVIGIFGSILIPGVYLSITTYHMEILPSSVLISLAEARSGIPFPAWWNLFLTLLVFDLIREATTRMLPHVSDSMSFVGTLVLGSILMDSRIICAPVIIIAGLSGILTLLNMSMSSTIIVMRYTLLLGAAFFGIYGTALLFSLSVLHLVSLRSFSVPYFMNLSRFDDHNSQDIWIRAPWRLMKLRPKIFGSRNPKRQATSDI